MGKKEDATIDVVEVASTKTQTETMLEAKVAIIEMRLGDLSGDSSVLIPEGTSK
ncbi:hypothetical protein [Spirochaeta cellobiosiphila]|uniref:hypothetical protein n=1 Tax=Spirochaeta cellobiosiphila TaxID=504483 RepID=UPI0012EBDE14|nr:hypothetical protein [Spirochaeta cellobiosiphila]